MTGRSRIEKIMIIQENAFKQKKENLDKNSTLGYHYQVLGTWPGNWTLSLSGLKQNLNSNMFYIPLDKQLLHFS